MKFKRYKNLSSFRADALPFLLKEEVNNNLPVSIISDSAAKSTSDWFMGTVTDESGLIILAALCTKPFNIMLSAHGSGEHARPAVNLLADGLRNIKFKPPGVLAKTGLAKHFTKVYKGSTEGNVCRTMVLMRLDRLRDYDKPSGTYRVLAEDDLSFVPFWEQAFSVDCNLPAFPLDEHKERIRTRIGNDSHYIWEDGLPVSQAVFGRQTPNGAVINWVYTPPLYRGRGYATAVVGELTKSLLGRGKKFCCLFADAGNPISRGIYSKLGYYDVCEFDDIVFRI